MTLEVDVLAKTVLSAGRKGLLRRKPIFRPHVATSSAELSKLEEEIGTSLPNDLRSWLLAVGYGDIDEELSFRREWLASIESGQLKGSARFAQDILGNFYAFDSGGRIFFLSRSEPVFAAMSNGFLEFIEELVRRDYKLVDWVNTLQTQKYEWQ
jgi:hypothetical protein